MTDPITIPRMQLAPHHLLILAGPVAVFLLLDLVLKSLGDPSLVLPAAEPVQGAQLIELTARYKFLTAFAFFGAVSLAVLAIFALDLWSNYTRHTSIACSVAILACAAVGGAFTALQPAAPGGVELRDLLGRGFFDAALGQGGVGSCPPGSACAAEGAVYVLQTISGPINALTSFALAAAMTGLILALAIREGAPPARPAAVEAAEITAARTVNQRYLYCAGLLLTSGITFLIAWMRWPSDLIADPVLQEHYVDLTSSISLYVGVGYSLLILSGYLPVSLILARRAERLRYIVAAGGAGAGEAAGTSPPVDVPELTYLDALKAIAAILSPILASAIGTFGSGPLFG